MAITNDLIKEIKGFIELKNKSETADYVSLYRDLVKKLEEVRASIYSIKSGQKEVKDKTFDYYVRQLKEAEKKLTPDELARVNQLSAEEQKTRKRSKSIFGRPKKMTKKSEMAPPASSPISSQTNLLSEVHDKLLEHAYAHMQTNIEERFPGKSWEEVRSIFDSENNEKGLIQISFLKECDKYLKSPSPQLWAQIHDKYLAKDADKPFEITETTRSKLDALRKELVSRFPLPEAPLATTTEPQKTASLSTTNLDELYLDVELSPSLDRVTTAKKSENPPPRERFTSAPTVSPSQMESSPQRPRATTTPTTAQEKVEQKVGQISKGIDDLSSAVNTPGKTQEENNKFFGQAVDIFKELNSIPNPSENTKQKINELKEKVAAIFGKHFNFELTNSNLNGLKNLFNQSPDEKNDLLIRMTANALDRLDLTKIDNLEELQILQSAVGLLRDHYDFFYYADKLVALGQRIEMLNKAALTKLAEGTKEAISANPFDLSALDEITQAIDSVSAEAKDISKMAFALEGEEASVKEILEPLKAQKAKATEKTSKEPFDYPAGVPGYNPENTVKLAGLASDKKPSVVAKAKIDKARETGGATVKIKASDIGSNIEGGPLTIDIGQANLLRDGARYFVGDELSPEHFIQLREALREAIKANESIMYISLNDLRNDKTQPQIAAVINDILKSNPSIDSNMPLTAFIASQVVISQPTLFVFDKDYKLATDAKPLVVLNASGIDFQDSRVMNYFFGLPQQPLKKEESEKRLKDALGNLIENELKLCKAQGIDVIVGMPRGLVSFAKNFLLEGRTKELDLLKKIYWETLAEKASKDEYKHLEIHINPLTGNKEIAEAALAKVQNVHIHSKDILSLATALNHDDRYKDKKIALQNAGDAKSLISRSKLGMHYEVEEHPNPKGDLLKSGADETLSRLGIEMAADTKEPGKENIITSTSNPQQCQSDLKAALTDFYKSFDAAIEATHSFDQNEQGITFINRAYNNFRVNPTPEKWLEVYELIIKHPQISDDFKNDLRALKTSIMYDYRTSFDDVGANKNPEFIQAVNDFKKNATPERWLEIYNKFVKDNLNIGGEIRSRLDSMALLAKEEVSKKIKSIFPNFGDIPPELSDFVNSKYDPFSRFITDLHQRRANHQKLESISIESIVDFIIANPLSAMAFLINRDLETGFGARNFRKELAEHPELIEKLIEKGSHKVRNAIITSDLLSTKHLDETKREKLNGLLDQNRSVVNDAQTINLIFKSKGNIDTDPFSALPQNLAQTRKNYSAISEIEIEVIVDYMIANPQRAQFFLERRTPIPRVGVRNFRKELGENPELIEKLINSGNPEILAAIEKTKLLDTSHLPKDLESEVINIQRDRQRFAFAKETPIALLDVDGTLFGPGGGEEKNLNLINALKEQGITQVILFTSFTGKNFSENLRDHTSRAEAIELLKKNGIQVLGIVVSGSPAYDKRLGSYYEEYYRSKETEASKLDFQSDEFKELSEAEKSHADTEKQAIDGYSKKHNLTGQHKDDMLHHVLRHLPDGAKVFVCDDNEGVVKDTTKTAMQPEVTKRVIRLDAIRIEMRPGRLIKVLQNRIKDAEKLVEKYKNELKNIDPEKEKEKYAAKDKEYKNQQKGLEDARVKLQEAELQAKKIEQKNSKEGLAQQIQDFKDGKLSEAAKSAIAEKAAVSSAETKPTAPITPTPTTAEKVESFEAYEKRAAKVSAGEEAKAAAPPAPVADEPTTTLDEDLANLTSDEKEIDDIKIDMRQLNEPKEVEKEASATELEELDADLAEMVEKEKPRPVHPATPTPIDLSTSQHINDDSNDEMIVLDDAGLIDEDIESSDNDEIETTTIPMAPTPEAAKAEFEVAIRGNGKSIEGILNNELAKKIIDIAQKEAQAGKSYPDIDKVLEFVAEINEKLKKPDGIKYNDIAAIAGNKFGADAILKPIVRGMVENPVLNDEYKATPTKAPTPPQVESSKLTWKAIGETLRDALSFIIPAGFRAKQSQAEIEAKQELKAAKEQFKDEIKNLDLIVARNIAKSIHDAKYEDRKYEDFAKAVKAFSKKPTTEGLGYIKTMYQSILSEAEEKDQTTLIQQPRQSIKGGGK